MLKLTQYKLELFLSNAEIIKIIDFNTKDKIDKLQYPLTSNNYKIYVVMQSNKFLYIGTTKDSIRNRIRSGLKANGSHGYHGYKWRHLKSVTLSVWDFENFDQVQIENIEAELAYLIRNKTKRWPEFQNEIHFNNGFSPTGQIIAEKIFRQLTQ